MAEKLMIDANALKSKLEERINVYIDAFGSYSKMPTIDKVTVDTINTCIADVVNAPTVDAVEVVRWATEQAYKNGYAKAVKEFAEKIDECLKRYSHLHKYADEAKHSTEKFADGTPMEMISVWDVFPLEKWEMVEYETMNTLQENIETIAKERLLTEFEKDLRIIIKEMVGVINA